MNTIALSGVPFMLATPVIAATIMAVLPGYRLGAGLNIIAAFLTFLAAVSLFIWKPAPTPYILVDDLNIVFVVLNTFVGFTTSVFSASYIAHELETGRLTEVHLRFYHAMYQVLLFAMNLALLTNNIGLMWVAIEIATLTTVIMVGIYRTEEAIEAAWKYFILGSVGIALALFGTILVYMAARPVVGEGQDGMVWTVLIQHVWSFDPALLDLAFVFVLLGYGTKVGLVPLHAWLPDAHAEGPTPISAVLSGLLLNVALYAVLRFKLLLAANPGAIAPGPLMAAMGVTSLIFASFMLYRRRDIKRMFGYSSIEHMGIIVFAFGMGGPLANFAGLLHMTMHSLTKSAIFFTVGHIAQVKGTQTMADIRGLTVTNPLLGWCLVLGVLAIAGMPPFGIFMSEFLVVSSTMARQPLLAIPLVTGTPYRIWGPALALAGIGIWKTERQSCTGGSVLFADCRASRPRFDSRDLLAGAARDLVSACRATARLTRRGPCFRVKGDQRVPTLAEVIAEGRMVELHRPCPRAVVNNDLWRLLAGRLAEGRGTLLGLWGEAAAVHMAILDETGRQIAVATLPCPDGRFASVGRIHPPAIRLERAIRDLVGLEPEGLPDLRPWLDHGRWGVRHPLAETPVPSGDPEPYAFCPSEGEGLHQIAVGPVHAGIIEPGHFRFTASGETVVRLEERLGYAHKGIEF